MRKLFIVTLILLIQGIIPVNSVQLHQESDLNIVATTTLVADFVTEVVGDLYSVDTIIKSGIDPHEYQATVDDASKLSNADIIFYLGGGVEESMQTTLTTFDNEGIGHALFSSLPENEILEPNGDHYQDVGETDHQHDPHFWHNPRLVKYAVDFIAEQMGIMDSQNNLVFQNNALEYSQELDVLYNFITNKTDLVDESDKFLITQHAAFNYWATEFGFTAKSLEGISTLDEAGIEEIDNLALYLKQNEIDVIFLESTLPDTNAQAVIDAAQALGWQVVVGGKIYSGALGDTEASTYIEMMTYNTETIVNAILSPPTPTQSAPINLLNILFALFIFPLILRRVKK